MQPTERDERGGPPPEEWEHALPFVLWRAQHAVHRRVQDALDPMDLTVTQIALAVHLEELGHLSASDLARRFRLAPQSVTTALRQLEDRGWLARRPHPVHRKVIWYELTDEGRARVAEGRARMAEVSRALTALVGPVTVNGLIGGLQELIDNVEPEGPVEPMWSVPTSSRTTTAPTGTAPGPPR
ncbi:MarR family transcriptional regulator [Microbacterium sp. LRZ72]|uniref:MarR family winged helix-turn-helix transcriptional regulator n=1 Tax=Microbacterium sp. LRZ72 TaxID=2942481 RepID=UPI0029B36A2B|nr:MarR family transcriptional regulator [Microbacterium sp. LRZ72]MDX2376326.1 MarR family transcriptional regulator [Microbacterium sp. LRZ72]